MKLSESYSTDTTGQGCHPQDFISVSYSVPVILFGTLFATLKEVRRDLEDIQKVKNWLVSVVLLIMLIN